MPKKENRQNRQESNGKMHLIINPNAGKYTKWAGIGRIVGDILSSPDNPHRIYDTETLHDLDQAVSEINGDSGPGKMVATASGDGGVHEMVTRVVNHNLGKGLPLPDFVIFAGGTMNMVATALGCNRRTVPPTELAKRIKAKLASGAEFQYRHARVMKVNDEYGFIFGVGLPVNILQEYYDDTVAVRGGLQAAKVIANLLMREAASRLTLGIDRKGLPPPVHASINMEGHELPFAPYMSHSAIICSTIEQVGFNCRAMPGALHYGEFQNKFLLRSSQLSYLQLLAMLIPLWFASPLPETFDAPVSKVTITYTEPTVTMVDGELRESNRQDVIEIGPLLRFIVG